MRNCFSLVALLITAFVASSFVAAAPPRTLPEKELPADARLEPLKDLNGYFPMQNAANETEWAKRSERVRRQILVALGLWPMPTQTPLNPVIHGKIEFDDYTVEKAYFESFPGYFVTGNLYRPKNFKGKRPGILCPHGHWANGRFYDAGEKAVKAQIAEGAEASEEGGRSPLQARCVQLARMGCVVFHYDMAGYADCTQISYQLVHRFAKQRPEMNAKQNWGLYGPQAEANLQSVMGVQSYNSVRAIDFLQTLDEVDDDRIAVTGSSGGGTQTMLLAGIDPRPAVSFPAVMVSTSMQGGCTCENCSLLRVGTGNIEFAALFAPKPQGVTSADDWTREMRTKGFPELKKHYEMLGAGGAVMHHDRTEFKHNYNLPSRLAMYHWFNKYLNLGVEEPIEESEFKRLSTEEMTVWNDKHPQPAGGEVFERQLLKWWKEDADKQLNALLPTDKPSLRKFREVVGGGVDIIIGRGMPAAKELTYEATGKTEHETYLEIVGLVTNESRKEQLPMVFLHPKNWNGKTVIWLGEQGKAGLYGKDGKVLPAVMELVNDDATVIGVDLLYQGEFLEDGRPLTRRPRVNGEESREFAGYTFGYNHSVFASRVHDVLTTIAFVKNHELSPQRISLYGKGTAAAWAAAARAQAQDVVDQLVIDTEGFRFADIEDINSPNFTPGGAKYFDLPGMIALSAPYSVVLAGEKETPKIVSAAFLAGGDSSALQVHPGNMKTADAVKHLGK